MNEPRQEEQTNGQEQRTEEMRQKVVEMQEKMTYGINKALCSTAEGLDIAAERMHKTADFFRNKTTSSIQDDMTTMARKYPGKAIAGAVIFGVLLGRMLSR